MTLFVELCNIHRYTHTHSRLCAYSHGKLVWNCWRGCDYRLLLRPIGTIQWKTRSHFKVLCRKRQKQVALWCFINNSYINWIPGKRQNQRDTKIQWLEQDRDVSLSYVRVWVGSAGLAEADSFCLFFCQPQRPVLTSSSMMAASPPTFAEGFASGVGQNEP